MAWWLLALVPALTPQLAHGDAGIVLLHEAKGPFLITVFSALELTSGGLTDVSVLLQSSTDGALLLDADVELAIESPRRLEAFGGSDPVCGLSSASPSAGRQQEVFPATRRQASNKLLYASALPLNAAGDWRLQIRVCRGLDSKRFDCSISGARAPTNARALWPCFLIPPIAIVAFVLNQVLRRRSLEERPQPQSRFLSRI